MTPRGTRWRDVLRECAGWIHREARITLTPLTEPERWAFVVGCYNSGTELLSRLLATHPSVSALPHEGQFHTREFPADYELGLPRMWVLREDLFRLTEEDDGPDPTRLKKEWLARLDRSRPIFLEKSPPNAARTRWLQHHFTDAHFVAIVRNGYAVAEGIRRKAEPRHLRDGWPLELCAHQWNESNRILLEDASHLRHIHWVRYEDLVEEPDHHIREIFRFLGVAESGIAEVDVSGQWAIHEREEPIRNMNDESIGRLTDEELEVIREVAATMLDHFEYEKPSRGSSSDQ